VVINQKAATSTYVSERMELRINAGENKKWIYSKVYIPEKVSQEV